MPSVLPGNLAASMNPVSRPAHIECSQSYRDNLVPLHIKAAFLSSSSIIKLVGNNFTPPLTIHVQISASLEMAVIYMLLQGKERKMKESKHRPPPPNSSSFNGQVDRVFSQPLSRAMP